MPTEPTEATKPTPKPVETLVNALRSYEEFGRLTDDVQESLNDLLAAENDYDDEPEPAQWDDEFPQPVDPDSDTTDDKTGDTP